MKKLGIFSNVNTEAALIIVASVNARAIADLANPDRVALRKLIAKTDEYRSIASPSASACLTLWPVTARR
jgi:hypothetical protein